MVKERGEREEKEEGVVEREIEGEWEGEEDKD